MIYKLTKKEERFLQQKALDWPEDRAFLYIKKSPNKENAIMIMQCLVGKEVKNPKRIDEIKIMIESFVEIEAGKRANAFYLKGEDLLAKRIAVDELLYYLSGNILKGYFEDDMSVEEFLDNNEVFADRTGIKTCFENLDKAFTNLRFFMHYLLLYVEYPSIEQIVKMGYTLLASKMVDYLENNDLANLDRSKDALLHFLRVLIDPFASEGKKALLVPDYVAKRLNQNKYALSDWFGFSRICRFEKISEQDFNKLIESKYYELFRRAFINGSSKFMELYGLGYKTLEVLDYFIKQRHEDGQCLSFYQFYIYLVDYHHLCDCLEIEAEKFPQKLKQEHDELMYLAEANQNAQNNVILSRVAKAYEEVVDKCNKLSDKYSIVIPSSVQEFIQEGHDMDNCVGSYVDDVAKRFTTVFFVRKKKDLGKSFITGEYRNKNIEQLFYSHNRPVENDEIKQFVNVFKNNSLEANLI